MTQDFSEYNNVINRFTGFSDQYHKFRPEPPAQIYQVLSKLSNLPYPELVVDLGCGTGISTVPWSKYSKYIIGIDPSQEMLSEAIKHNHNKQISFQKGYGNKIPVASDSVDIISCSSSIHWMEPVTTFTEIQRVLKPLGVFAAFGPQIPILPLNSIYVASAFRNFIQKVKAIEKEDHQYQKPQEWKWNDIHSFIKKSEIFNYTDELCFHKIVEWDSDAYCGWVLTISYVNALIKNNKIVALEFDTFTQLVKHHFGSSKQECLLSYRLLLGIMSDDKVGKGG